jgi:hypothetical protein
MKSQQPQVLTNWRIIAGWFPPKVPAQIKLFRLVTIPIRLARQQTFRFRPAMTPVSSWSTTLVGIDAVAGVAREFHATPDTTRVAIETVLPGKLVLATTQTIKRAFMTLSHDYFERYPEKVERKKIDGQIYITTRHPGYPGGDDAMFTMDDVGFLQDVLNRKGGHLQQYEYVLETPSEIEARVVQVYRVGDDVLRWGNDDPHNGSGQRVPILSPARIASVLAGKQS